MPLSIESITATLLHELGHFVGLAHTSEADGRVFDVLGDTPRCEAERHDGAGPNAKDGVVDERECADGGGANNVMFWSAEVGAGPWTLTPAQAWVLRRHPLFYPADTTTEAATDADGPSGGSR